jgi:hypothetical protein
MNPGGFITKRQAKTSEQQGTLVSKVTVIFGSEHRLSGEA